MTMVKQKSRQEKLASFLAKEKPAKNNNHNNHNGAEKKYHRKDRASIPSQPVAEQKQTVKVAKKERIGRSENRQVLCFFDPSTNKIKGVFLDAGHAANVLGMDIHDIKNDIMKGTEKTGGVWIKAPVGDTVNHREIQKLARQMYKEMRGVHAGRKPNIPREETIQKIQALDFSKMDDRAFRKINRLITALENGPKPRKPRTKKAKSKTE